MVNNSFLCHFPSHYLLRMNCRIHCFAAHDQNVNFLLGFVAGSLRHVYLAIPLLASFVSWKWIPVLGSPMNTKIFDMKTKNAVPIPPHIPPTPLWILSSDKARTDYRLRMAGLSVCRCVSSKSVSQIFIIQTILLWRNGWYSKTECTWEPIPRICCCKGVSIGAPGPFWGRGGGDPLLAVIVLLSSKS